MQILSWHGQVCRLLRPVVASARCATARFNDRGETCAHQLQYRWRAGGRDERQSDGKFCLLRDEICKPIWLLRIQQRSILIAGHKRVAEEHDAGERVCATTARRGCCYAGRRGTAPVQSYER